MDFFFEKKLKPSCCQIFLFEDKFPIGCAKYFVAVKGPRKKTMGGGEEKILVGVVSRIQFFIRGVVQVVNYYFFKG